MKKNFTHKNKNLKIKYKSDISRPTINQNCEERNWESVEVENQDFNIYWATVKTVRTKIFHSYSKIRLKKHQLINHFPNYYELTRKDLLVKNIKRLNFKIKKIKTKNGTTIDTSTEIIPKSYILPSEYQKFLSDYKKDKKQKWIFKPACGAQGTSIKLITKLTEAKEIPKIIQTHNSKNPKDKFVICKYINNPLLILNRKFDLRTYILVTNYNPLKVWRYKEGFARVCFEDYEKIDQNCKDPNGGLFSHLTNVSFQKKSIKYNDKHGGKWPLSSFFKFVEVNFGRGVLKKIEREMDSIYLMALKSVQYVICNDGHCFELYGFDVLIDEEFKCWLIEVNASPSLLSTTKQDFVFKKKMISDVFDVLFPERFFKGEGRSYAAMSKEEQVGGFEVIYDESEGKGELKDLKFKKSRKGLMEFHF